MNQRHRQMVLDYCAFEDTYPLYFKDYKSPNNEFDPEKYTVEDMIRRVLTLSESYSSYNSNTHEYESSSDRWRSVLDIWRHILYYYPTIDIFDVMHGMYNIHDECGGQFCHDIERRTFKLKTANGFTKGSIEWRMWDNQQSGEIDEFELNWEDWKDI